MNRCVRVILDGGRGPYWDMTLDLVLDQSGRPKRGIPFCGWWGKIGSTDLLPIVVLKDGRVDFGSDESTDQSDRHGQIKIHDCAILDGGIISYVDSVAGEMTFRVKNVDDLMEV